MRACSLRARQNGQVLAEFSFAIIVLFCFAIGVTEMCHAIWDYVQLTELARRGVRYAVDNPGNNNSVQAIQNVVVYGQPTVDQQNPPPAALPGLERRHVAVSYRTPEGRPANPSELNSNVLIFVTIRGYEFSPWFVPDPKDSSLGLGFKIPLPTVNVRLMVESQGENN